MAWETHMSILCSTSNNWKIMQQTSGHKARFIAPIKLTSKMTIFLNDRSLKELRDIFKIMICSKLCWFQFRMINHILTINFYRSRWNSGSQLLVAKCCVGGLLFESCILPLLKYVLGNNNWLPCWLSRGWHLLHQRWILWNVHHVCLCQVQIKLSTLALKPRGGLTRNPNRGISGPIKEHVSTKKF